jgi:signal transduction histidine kinase
MLQTAEVQALEQDSTVFYTGTISQQTYRNLLVRESERSTIKAITILPGYQNILFAFFRLSFTLLIAGFLLLMIYKWVKTGRLQFFGANKQFKYRILDSFLLATLLFLIILVISTHFAIGQQNKKLVQQELFETLESITDNPNTATAFRTNPQGAASSVLDSLIAPYNIDAALYDAEGVTQSTTPQIYQQHLLPGALPFPVYDALFRMQKRNALSTVRLDKQDLLIGYRSILSEDGTPVAVMAMPTFVQSPKYNRQLLETTSYLIILYLVIFGLFVVGTTFIAHQLTRSLPLIRQGLNKISEGDLSTTIPDTGKDEIGSLATAYNEMVGRLQQLQDELATAEREAAWKEMAQQVAHEIKNPLTPMKLNIQHLERQISSENYDAEQLKEKITSITKNLVVQIQSLSNIASDFSTFAKPIEDDFSAVDIHPLIKSVCELYEHDDAITTTIETKAEKSVVWGAKDELRRMFINLIKNAREAMPHGGTIAISTYVREKNIFIEIDDTGTGMSEEDKSNIFVPNFSTKSSGTGLGLAISKKVLEAHEGSISFASIKGEGTTFVVKIPLVKR